VCIGELVKERPRSISSFLPSVFFRLAPEATFHDCITNDDDDDE